MTTPAEQMATAIAQAQQEAANVANPWGAYIGFDGVPNLPKRRVPVLSNPYFDVEGISRESTPTYANEEIIPIYKQGFEWSFASLPQDDISDLQQRLVASGLLRQYSPGFWDASSASAMEYVMTIANFSGKKYDEVLNQLVAAGGIQKAPSAGGGGGLAAPTMTDEDIRMVANKTAQGVLGRNLREDEISGFVPAFRSMFAGGTSAATAGETVVREQVAPDEAAAYGLGNVMQSIGSLLGGGGR